MTGRLLLDLTHTSHTHARTGIQRVVRALHRELGERAAPVTYDPYSSSWRSLESWERANLAATNPGGKRSASWPLAARVRGRVRRAASQARKFAPPADCAGFLTAELFSPAVGANLPDARPRVAVFHDAIALRFPELTPSTTVARFPGYMRELLNFDGVAAVSADSRDSLLDYWRWLGVAQTPPVVAITLGVDPSHPLASRAQSASERNADKVFGDTNRPVILSVGTLEGRKNHSALFEACELRWARGEKFSLRLAGAAQSQTGRAALDRVRQLQAAGRPLRYDGPLSDAAVDEAYAECAFTVYPSIAEGFGLPVIESLAHGRPCICSGRGALGEISRLGGCVALEAVDATSLAGAIGRLLTAPDELVRLATAARARSFKTWNAYATELVDWMQTLR